MQHRTLRTSQRTYSIIHIQMSTFTTYLFNGPLHQQLLLHEKVPHTPSMNSLLEGEGLMKKTTSVILNIKHR